MDVNLHGVNFELVVPTLVGTSKDTGTVKKLKKSNKDTDSENDQKVSDVNGSTSSISKSKLISKEEDTKINLDRGELLKLLSVFEGELQARDEVIAILKSECSNNVESRYGLACQPLKALQRDATSFDSDENDEDIGAHTKEQLKTIVQKQKDGHRKLKQMFLASQEKNQKIKMELNVEQRKQQEYMLKSDDFVNLLEEDRERLKQLLNHEKMNHERKERELSWKIKEGSEELNKMKSLSIELIEERQKQLQSFAEQRQLTLSLQTNIEELKVKVSFKVLLPPSHVIA